jgi:hypothetical protein
MNNSTLTATLGSATNAITFQEADDTDAIWTAMFKILDAATGSRLWAKGEIILAGPGGVIKTMAAKA